MVTNYIALVTGLITISHSIFRRHISFGWASVKFVVLLFFLQNAELKFLVSDTYRNYYKKDVSKGIIQNINKPCLNYFSNQCTSIYAQLYSPVHQSLQRIFNNFILTVHVVLYLSKQLTTVLLQIFTISQNQNKNKTLQVGLSFISACKCLENVHVFYTNIQYSIC